jgi:hypothetical protein
MFTPFTSYRVVSMDDISDGHVVRRCSMTFRETFDKDSIDGNYDE